MEKENQPQTYPVAKKDVLGIISLILAIVSVIGCWIPLLNVISMIIGIVAGILGICSFVNFFRKKSNSCVLPIIGIILSIVSVCMACSVNNAVATSAPSLSSSSSKSSVAGTASTNSSKSETEKTVYNVGDVIAFDSKEVTVTKVDRNYTPKYITAKSGKEFIKVGVKIENKSTSNISANPYDFKIQDSNGTIDNVEASTYSLDDQFESVELIPGGVKTGSVVFEVPKNDSGLKFIYQPSFWSDKKVEVKL